MNGTISTWKSVSDPPLDGVEVDLWFGDNKPAFRLIDCRLNKGSWFYKDKSDWVLVLPRYGNPTDWMLSTDPTTILSGPVADLEKAVAGITDVINFFDKSIRAAAGNPDNVTVNFGLGFQGGIPFLAQGNTSINVSLTWGRPHGN